DAKDAFSLTDVHEISLIHYLSFRCFFLRILSLSHTLSLSCSFRPILRVSLSHTHTHSPSLTPFKVGFHQFCAQFFMGREEERRERRERKRAREKERGRENGWPFGNIGSHRKMHFYLHFLIYFLICSTSSRFILFISSKKNAVLIFKTRS